MAERGARGREAALWTCVRALLRVSPDRADAGGAEPVTAGWIREQSPPDRLDAPALIGRLDAWWPAIFSVASQPRASATVTFTAELLCDPATLPAAEPLFYRAHVAALREWMFVEFRELWHQDRLVAMNQQTFALLG